MSEEPARCPHCGKEAEADATKCEHCGGVLKTPGPRETPSLGATYIQAVCPQCGKVHQLHPSHEGREFHCDCSEVIKVPPRDHPESTSLADKETLPVPMPSDTGPSIEIVSEAPDKKEGILFAERYRIIRKLGEGGMGSVYLAHDETLDVDVAFKVLKGEDFADEADIERFMREARAAAKLNHPNIARVLNAGTYEHGHHYIAMEYIDGQPLDSFLQLSRIARPDEESKHALPKPRLDDRQLTQVFSEVANALAYAHKNGVVHRDIKPGNVLVDKEGKACLTDFGLAKQIRGEKVKSVTRTGVIVGTPWYMSPEQAEGKSGRVTPASDIFSFGAMMYHVFCRRLPFDADSMLGVLRSVLVEEPKLPRRIRSSIHPDMDAIIMRCLEKAPARRYRNGEELAADLKRFLLGESVVARPMSSLRQILRRLKRKKAFVSAVVAIVLAVVVVVGMFAYREIERSQREQHAQKKAAALLQEGNIAFKNRETEKALELVSKSLGIMPDNKEAQELKSHCEERITKRKKAQELLSGLDFKTTRDEKLQLLDKVIATDASLVEPYIEKGKILSRILRVEEAKAAFEKAIELAQVSGNKEHQVVIHLHMACLLEKAAYAGGHTQEELRDLDKESCSHYRRILDLKPNDTSPVTLLAKAWDVARRRPYEDLDAADKILDQALAMNPEFVEAMLMKITIYRVTPDEYMRLLGRIIELEPDNAWAHGLRGISHYVNGDYEHAIDDATRAIEINPNDPAFHAIRGWSHVKTDSKDLAMKDFHNAVEKAKEMNKELGAAYSYHRGIAKKLIGDHAGFVSDIASALGVLATVGDVDSEHVLWQLRDRVWSYPLIHNFRTAECTVEDLRSVVGLLQKKGNGKPLQLAYLALAHALKGESDFDAAIQTINRLIQLGYGDKPHCLCFRAECLRGKGDLQAAIKDYEKVLELDPKRWQVLEILAELHEASGNLDRAIEALGKFCDKVETHESWRMCDYLKKRAALFMKKGDLRAAEKDYTKIIKNSANNRKCADAYIMRGDLKLSMDNYDGAIRDCTEVIEIQPENVDAYTVRGVARHMKGEYGIAIKDYTKAITLVTSRKKTWWQHYLDTEEPLPDDSNTLDFEEAALPYADIEELMTLYSSRAGAHRMKGDLENAKTDQTASQAMRTFGNGLALSMCPYDKRCHASRNFYGAAKLLESLGKKDLAALAYFGCARASKHFHFPDYPDEISCYTKAIEFDPDFAEAYYARGRLWPSSQADSSIRDLKKAIELFRSAEKKEKAREVAHYWCNRCVPRAENYLEKGDRVKATEWLERTILVDPEYAHAYTERARLWLKDGKSDRALEDYAKAIQLDPKSPVAYLGRARVLASKGDIHGAAADYNKAIELIPKDATFYCWRGEARQVAGNTKGAIEDYTKAGWYYESAQLRQLIGDKEGAIADYLKSIEMSEGWAVPEKLLELREKRAVVPLIKGLELDDEKIRCEKIPLALLKHRNWIIEPLVEALSHNDNRVKCCAAIALTMIDGINDNALQKIVSALDDKDTNVRMTAALSLPQVKEDKVKSRVSAALNDVEALIEVVNTEWNPFRYRAAEVLGDIGEKQAIEPIMQALQSKCDFVRTAAAGALKKLTNQDFGTDYEKWKAWYEKNKDK